KQKTIPISSRVCPSIPRNLTCDKSGSFNAASPPPCDWAKVAGAPIAAPTTTDKIVNTRRPSAVAKFDVKFTIKKILSVASKEGKYARLKSRLLWPIWAGTVQRGCAVTPQPARRQE